MRIDLTGSQDPWHQDRGMVSGGDGRGYARQSTRMARREADGLVADGVPLILDLYAREQLEWCDGDDAVEAWSQVRSYVVRGEPTAKQLAKHVMWTAGAWQSADGARVLYPTGRC